MRVSSSRIRLTMLRRDSFAALMGLLLVSVSLSVCMSVVAQEMRITGIEWDDEQAAAAAEFDGALDVQIPWRQGAQLVCMYSIPHVEPALCTSTVLTAGCMRFLKPV